MNKEYNHMEAVNEVHVTKDNIAHSKKKRKLLDTSEQSSKSRKEVASSSVMDDQPILSNVIGDTCAECLEGVPQSGCLADTSEIEVVAEHHASSNYVTESISEDTLTRCPDGEYSAMKLPVADVAVGENSEQTQCTKVDVTCDVSSPKKMLKKFTYSFDGDKTVVDAPKNGLHKEIVDQMIKFEKGKSTDSLLKSDAITENVIQVPIKEHQTPAVLPPSLERDRSAPPTKKLLVLDVNGLLADIIPYTHYCNRADTIIGTKAVFKRPYCDDFLQFCFQRFNVGFWSSRTRRNVEQVLDFLLGNTGYNVLFCWDQSHCTATGFNTIENKEKPLVLKELKKLWDKEDPNLPWNRGDFDESNTLLLDDSPYKALRNPPHTAIFPHSYNYRDRRDNQLGPGGDLREYLEKLASAKHVQKYVEQHPFGQRPITKKNLSWKFYLRVIGYDPDQAKAEATTNVHTSVSESTLEVDQDDATATVSSSVSEPPLEVDTKNYATTTINSVSESSLQADTKNDPTTTNTSSISESTLEVDNQNSSAG